MTFACFKKVFNFSCFKRTLKQQPISYIGNYQLVILQFDIRKQCINIVLYRIKFIIDVLLPFIPPKHVINIKLIELLVIFFNYFFYFFVIPAS